MESGAFSVATPPYGHLEFEQSFESKDTALIVVRNRHGLIALRAVTVSRRENLRVVSDRFGMSSRHFSR